MSQLQWRRIRLSGFLDDDFAIKLQTLTPREWAVVEQLLSGRTCQQTAAALQKGYSTVRTQRRVILQKLNVVSEIDLLPILLSHWLGTNLPPAQEMCHDLRQRLPEAD